MGHAGTLDPLATGVLILCTGKATKRIEELQAHTKEYIATMKLGETTLFDMESLSMPFIPVDHITRELMEEILKKFVGTIEQIRLYFCKIGGKRAYDLARKGREVPLKKRHWSLMNWNCWIYYAHRQDQSCL